MTQTEKNELLKALALTAELTGTQLSKEALRAMAAELGGYEFPVVVQALTSCRRELQRSLTLATIIERVVRADGRPTADEAWAMIPKDEQGSVVWTQEMAAAFAVCADLIGDRDSSAARMAFRAAYEREVATAREQTAPVQWFPSLGWDTRQRAGALELAVEKKRISPAHAASLLPDLEASPTIKALLAPVVKKLTDPDKER